MLGWCRGGEREDDVCDVARRVAEVAAGGEWAEKLERALAACLFHVLEKGRDVGL